MPEMIATEKRQRVECVIWEAELTSVPPGAVRHVVPGMKPPCGFKKVLVLNEQAPEKNGVYFVPAIELLPPREKERAKRSQKREELHIATATAAACERVRLFLAEADLTDQSLADARAASDLRHRLRTPSPDVLRAAVLFLGGVCPARPGQAALVNELLHRLKPEGPHRTQVSAATNEGSR